ncbi:MAG: hypothetical protein JRM76_00195 [Nitrososphaerota archaeon]|nr:hypothetical protein [Nitrososphaerota archaeon]
MTRLPSSRAPVTLTMGIRYSLIESLETALPTMVQNIRCPSAVLSNPQV